MIVPDTDGSTMVGCAERDDGAICSGEYVFASPCRLQPGYSRSV